MTNKYEDAVFITGAGQRIGAFLVRQFIHNTDFPIVFTYRSHRAEVDELIALGAIGIQADFNDLTELPGLVEQVKTHCKSLRLMIHNASLWLNDEQAPPLSEKYAELFKVHVETPNYLNQLLQPLLQASSSPLKDIISLSDYSVNKVQETHIAYLSSKAALQNLSMGFAKKFAPEIKVNDIAPALIKFNQGDDEDYKHKRLAQAALPIEPGYEVVWQAVQYLMNSPYTTGTSLQLNGGRHLL
ncbi:dihydromonapterin reductase [Thiomicrorhabdus sp. Milos-T2]|uniref:dihydromonapterin reductase n=1 Tax=Thiomicrorhabdus sp. Milos-T2 TaxID=90814 RepID=UPI000493C43B|nr:dihydromonapterin reductase [Thiomicrorhabdus sp. Milos-T2]